MGHDIRKKILNREAGCALVDHLTAMGVSVSTDFHENRCVLKSAERDHSSTGKVRHLKTVNGDSYGFTYRGRIHLNLRKIDAELPLHEYAHLWCEALRRINPDNWNRVVLTMKQDSDIWQFVKTSYPELSDDNDLAEEVIAHYSGRRGSEKLHAELERMTPKDTDYASRWGNIFQNIVKVIQDFWKHVGDSVNYHYVSKDDLADQILNDFAKQVNPVKKVEKWLSERDTLYADAVENDPDLAVRLFEEALQENIGNGVTPFMAVDGYRGKLDQLAHAVKEHDNAAAIQQAADMMAPLVPPYSVLVPAPSHDGMATDMKLLAEAISERTGSPVADILKGKPRDSQYNVKKTTGKPLSSGQLGIHQDGDLPIGYLPVVIDNVVHSGNTAEACVQALGKGIVLSLASAVSQDRHVASLKSLSPIVYDKDGNLVPLSKRFELKNRYLGRVMNFKYLDGVAADDKPVRAIGVRQRLDILTKPAFTNVENPRVGYSKLITDGKEEYGFEHLERSLFYDGKPFGSVMVDVESDGNARVSYLLDVRVHPFDIADNAWEGIDGLALDDNYDYGCIRFDDETSLVDFYESHKDEIDYRNGRFSKIQELSDSEGQQSAERLSLDYPVQYPFKPVTPLREWADIATDTEFLQKPSDVQKRLIYQPGETLEAYKDRNHLYSGDDDFVWYFYQKYSDQWNEVRDIFSEGLTDENCENVVSKVAALVDTKDEGLEIRSLLNYSNLHEPFRYYDYFVAAFDRRNAVHVDPIPDHVQGLEGYSVDDIKSIVVNYIEDKYGDLFLDDGFMIKEITVIGSRSRGEAREDSDLDILLEYAGSDFPEDALFNIFNYEPLEIDGIKVDINPISEKYSLNTTDWLARDAKWHEEARQEDAVKSAEKDNDKSKNILVMQTSIVESNLELSIKETHERVVQAYVNAGLANTPLFLIKEVENILQDGFVEKYNAMSVDPPMIMLYEGMDDAERKLSPFMLSDLKPELQIQVLSELSNMLNVDVPVIATEEIGLSQDKYVYTDEQAEKNEENKKSVITVEQLQEKAAKLFGNIFEFDFWHETEPGTKIDRIDLGSMPDTISIDKLEIKDGKLCLYSNDIASNIDLHAMDAVEIAKIAASLDEIKEYLDAHQNVEKEHDDRPYHISYGDDPTGVVEGDIHVHFTKELAYVSFEDFKHFAEDLGGSVRIMNGERWADFYHQDDAEKFANTVVDVDVSRMAAAREGAKQQPKVSESQVRDDILAERVEEIQLMENKDYSPEEAIVVKEATGLYLEKMRSDYYHMVDADVVSSRLDNSDIDSRKDLLSIAYTVAWKVIEEAVKKEPGIMERYLPVGMSLEEECGRVATEAVNSAESFLDTRKNNLREVIDERLDRLNEIVLQANELQKKEDPEYMMKRHVTGYSVSEQNENCLAVMSHDGDSRNFVTSWTDARGVMDKLDSIEKDIIKRYPGLAALATNSEVRLPEEKSVVNEGRDELKKDRKRSVSDIHKDFQAYYIPDGMKIENASVFQRQKGADAGKYCVFAVIDNRKRSKVFDPESEEDKKDLNYFFKCVKKGERSEAINNLIAKFFGKAHVQEASLEEGLTGEKKPVGVIDRQRDLLAFALTQAAKDGILFNRDYMPSPCLKGSDKPVSAFNLLMMSLHTQKNGFPTGEYVSFKSAQTQGFSVLRGQTALPFDWFTWDHYVSRINEHDIIDSSHYEKLDDEMKGLYRLTRAKQTQNVFNLAQTSYGSLHRQEYEDSKAVRSPLVSQPLDSPSEGLRRFYDVLHEHYNSSMLFMRQDDGYAVYGGDAIKAATFLGREVTLSNRLDGDGDPMNMLIIPKAEMNEVLFTLVPDINAIVCEKEDCLVHEGYLSSVATIHDSIDMFADRLVASDDDRVLFTPLLPSDYRSDNNTLIINSSRVSEYGKELEFAVKRASDVYRNTVAYIGAPSRLNRQGSQDLLPADAVKYDRLVQELSAAAVMVRHGLPASVSAENRSLLDYWQRELKEDPSLVIRLENDVNTAVEVIDKIFNGEEINYAAYRSNHNYRMTDPRHYSISSELNKLPDVSSGHVVVIRQKDNMSADVIMPQGASMNVENEAENITKNALVISLGKEGYQDVRFFNAGGSLGMKESNDYYKDKQAELCSLSDRSLVTLETYDLSDEIARSKIVDIEYTDMIAANETSYALYIKPLGQDALVVFPDPNDIQSFFDVAKNARDRLPEVRESLGRKYYNIVLAHPELRADILMPKQIDVDYSRLSNINIRKDKMKPDEGWKLYCDIDGKHQKPVPVDKISAKHFWLVDDKDMFKSRLAAIMFAEKLGYSEGRNESQFRGSGDEVLQEKCGIRF